MTLLLLHLDSIIVLSLIVGGIIAGIAVSRL